MHSQNFASGDWSGFGIHLQFFIKSIDESNEHQVIEDQPESIAVFIVGRSMVKFELETRNQITVGSGQFEERPMFYIIFGNFGFFNVTSYVKLWGPRVR